MDNGWTDGWSSRWADGRMGGGIMDGWINR